MGRFSSFSGWRSSAQRGLVLYAMACICVWAYGLSPQDKPDSGGPHPRIYATDADRSTIRDKVNRYPWATEVYHRLVERMEPLAERLQTDPTWLTSRLAMYWREGEHYTQCYLEKQNWARGEGNAPLPTVRMPGMRTWNKYSNVPLEDRTPYNETGDMWGVNRADPDAAPVLVPYKESGHMIRGNNVEVLTLAEQAAFLYWLNEDDRYGSLAADVFFTWLLGTYYMNPILDPDQSTGGPGGYEPGGICGYYDYEQIHDDLALHAALVYDFAYDYLQTHPHPHLAELGLSMEEVVATVFKRFIDIGLVRGGKSGNWNVNGWNMMLLPILALEDDGHYTDGHGRSYYLHLLTDQSTPYHDAIPDILQGYDPVTGLWPESPGYSFGTVAMLLDFAHLLMRQGIDILANNPVLERAAMAVFPWMDERANMVVFGDTRGGSANFSTFERLLAYYTQVGDTARIGTVAAALQTGIRMGSYRREQGDWTTLCTLVPEIPSTAGGVASGRASYSPYHRMAVMKSEPCEGYGLMAMLYGGREGSHLSPNGLALQLYGFGYALAPDASGYESYWSADNRYHQSATGSNTILPGYTQGDVSIRLMEPLVEAGQYVNATALSPYINVCEMEAGEKRRLVAMVRTTSAGGGYYVDLFRSGQTDNDYILHNVGLSLSLCGADGQELPLSPVESFGKTYGDGYNWFTQLKALPYTEGFRAVWTIATGKEPLSMQLWMTGVPGRTLYTVSAPPTTLNPAITPGGVSAAPRSTPTLLVRQEGQDAWQSPFIAVMQPVEGEQGSVRSVSSLLADGERAAIRIALDGNRTDYILSGTSPEVTVVPSKQLALHGAFGLVTEVDGQVKQLYMVDGYSLSRGHYSITSEAKVSASLWCQDGVWTCSCTGPIRVRLGRKTYHVDAGLNQMIK